MHGKTTLTVRTACVCVCVCYVLCVWGSHCNCRLLVSVSNCSVKLVQAVASSMKLQVKFHLLHIHCLHRDHGQVLTRVYVHGAVIVCTIVSQFSEGLAKTPLFESLESVRFFWLKKLILLLRKHALN